MADEEEFKKYQKIMATKRTRKTERNKGKDRLLPEKLTIQRLAPQVKGSSQKYARMGPLKRVDVLEDDMCAPQTIDVVRRACIAGFNMKGFDCDILETERGPSIETLNEIKNFNGTIFVRFIHKQYSVDDVLGGSDEEDEKSMPLKCKLPPTKRCKSSHTKQQSSEPTKFSVAKPQKSFPPSLSVATMLKMGKLIQPAKRDTIQVQIEGFAVKDGWTVAKTVTLSVESESFAEGGFRKAYKCESIDGKLSGKWVLKKYKENALEDMKSVNLTEEEHARKQVQTHTLAQNIAIQMQRNVPETFGETFTYDSMLFGKIVEDNGDVCFVTIERYLEGSFTKYINNNGKISSSSDDDITKKAETLMHYSYQVSQGECLLVDIQGTGYQLYDPEVASKALMSDVGGADQLNFCIGNLSTEAIETFFEKHKCSIYCIMLGLKQDDPKYHVSFER
ncbi:transient receptor potential cation channel subfamily M member 6-like [Paramuricea clavata]|uniref:Transient receptor potential cation channel subfamily M member 6-like n=1 Tax=Paramuricea clavata TaxID=317549 RepID=A0A6S7G6B6_PARCT|nr:transient receptor potential cation channel subfamily M member 6-like [Paramuricea clavata]